MTPALRILTARNTVSTIYAAIAAGHTSAADLEDYVGHLDGLRVSMLSEDEAEADVATSVAAAFTVIARLRIALEAATATA